MGENMEFNWILKLNKGSLQQLEENQTRRFIKEGYRIYPLEKLIDLVDEDFTTYGAIQIKDYEFSHDNVGNKMTKGRYNIIHLCTTEEKEVLTKYNQGKYTKQSF
jgi:hypothetical protein